jgi:serine/threonine-protein kinase HipA
MPIFETLIFGAILACPLHHEAAMKQCTVYVCTDPAAPIAAGRFALDEAGQGHFVYGKSYLARPDAFSFDPVNLRLGSEQMRVALWPDESFGVLSDAGPNSWGKRITGSICQQENRPVPTNPVEWLLSSWHYGSGCLGFAPTPNQPPVSTIAPIALSALDQRLLQAMEDMGREFGTHPGPGTDPEISRILLQGASLGGARPKTVVMHDGMECIVKFNRKNDLFDVCAAEYASMRLAFLAEIEVPEFELVTIGDQSAFVVQRFDRTPQGGRIHYISASSLLNIGQLGDNKTEYQTRYSYGGIAELARAFNPQAVADARQLYRRMVFNILIGNIDDHLRNHGFLLSGPGDAYRLSPAFDMVPHPDSAWLPQSIGVGAQGAASTLANALSQCGRFFLSEAGAGEIIAEVRDVVANWRSVFREAGVSAPDRHRLSPCFAVAEAGALA